MPSGWPGATMVSAPGSMRDSETWVVLAAAAALIASGGLFFSEPFETSRPKVATPETDLTFELDSMSARLWQDPFTVVAHWEEYAARLQEQTPEEAGYRYLISQYMEAVQPRRLIVMPVMVHGGFYSESVEKRRRHRYAALSAMFALDYRSLNPEIMGKLELDLQHRQDPYLVPFEWFVPNAVHYDSPSTSLTDPNDRDPAPILLLWLDERNFGNRPLREITTLLEQVVHRIAPAQVSLEIDVNLLGPARSRMLNRMVGEVSQLISDGPLVPPGWKFSIYSPVATASAKLILGDFGRQIREALGYSEEDNCLSREFGRCKEVYGDRKFTSVYLIEQAFKAAGIDFFRTITSDKHLLETIVDKEFQFRNVPSGDSGDLTILVSEWDTFYGRSLPEAFIKHIREINGNNRNDAADDSAHGEATGDAGESEQKCPDGICHYVYMRGLDGEVLTGSSSQEDTAQEEGVQQIERAVGVNRFDYLRRLAQEIKDDLSGEFRTVRAVGVLGSDVYDKLLILQALRSSFPSAVFFTTDVDARYLHPAESDWTRGLVIAAGHDLKLDRHQLQTQLCVSPSNSRNLPPFRDNFQTSIFLAIQLALTHSFVDFDCDNNSLCNCHPSLNPSEFLRHSLAKFTSPMVFEVGVSSLIPLGQAVLSSQSHWLAVIAVATLLLLCSVYMFVMPNYSLRHLLIAAIAILVPTLVVFAVTVGDRASGEPFPLFNGSNMLPTLYVIYLTVIAMFFLYHHARVRLGNDARRLIREFKLVGSEQWRQYFLTNPYFGRQQIVPWKQLPRMCIDYLAHAFVGLATLHAAISIYVIILLGDFAPPVRGQITAIAYYVGGLAALSGFFLFTYLIADEARRCQRLAYDLLSATWRKKDKSLAKFLVHQGMETASNHPARDAMSMWRGVQVLADRTRTLEVIIYYPFAVLFLIILAHNSLIDNWEFVPSIFIVLVSGLLVNVACVLLLRQHTQRLRRSTIFSLQLALDKNPGQDAIWEGMITKVKDERRGAFRPFGTDTIIRAPLMLIGGFASLYLLDYITRLV